MIAENIKVNSGKGVITTNLYKPKNSIAVVVICSGTGIKQVFYADLAKWLCGKYITVITFDYSGIAQSLNGNIKSIKSNLIDWAGELDAVVSFAKETFPNHPLILIGHSLGGQLIGFAQNSLLCDKIILVAAQSGYWGFWKGLSKIKMFLTWYIIVPLLTGIKGYFSAKLISKMENLPKQVALQWTQWCRNKNYFYAEMKKEATFFHLSQSNILSISIEDDDYAPKEAVDWLTFQFTNTTITR